MIKNDKKTIMNKNLIVISGATAIAGAHAAMELTCLYCANLRAQRKNKKNVN